MRQSGSVYRWLSRMAAVLMVAPLAAEPTPPASVALTLDTSGSVGRRRARAGARPRAGHPRRPARRQRGRGPRLRRPVAPRGPADVAAGRSARAAGRDPGRAADSPPCTTRSTTPAATCATLPGARKAIVLITDGVDENSALNLEDGLRVATDAQIPVFAIGVGAHPQERVLRRIAKLTGGEYFAFEQARGPDLAALIAALPAEGTAGGASGAGRVASGPAVAARREPENAAGDDAAAARRARARASAAPSGSRLPSPPPPPSRSSSWPGVRSEERRPAPTCARPLPRGRDQLPVVRGRPGAYPRPHEAARCASLPELSATVLARMNTHRGVPRADGHPPGASGARHHAGAGARARCSSSARSPPTSIGRSRANDIQVDDVSISGPALPRAPGGRPVRAARPQEHERHARQRQEGRAPRARGGRRDRDRRDACSSTGER